MIKKTLSAIVALTLLSIIAIPYAGDSLTPAASPARAQQTVDSDDLATFVALMQYIRSDPTPADVKAANLPLLATLDTAFSDLYITGFITPYTGETPEQVKARLQSIPEESRFIAVMVESYRLTSNPLLLDIIHQLLPLYYVDFFTTAEDPAEFLKREEIENLADAFDSTDYSISAPTVTGVPAGGTSPSARSASDVDSDDLATFVALMQYIRSQPTPADVKAANLPLLATLDTAFSDLYITGFITPYTGETPEQVKARLQSIPEEDRFTAVMVESYRLTSNPLLLDIIHQLLPLYYVDFFTTTDLGGASDFLKKAEIASLAAAFDPIDYAIRAPTATATATPTLTATPTATPTATTTPVAVPTLTIAELVRNVQGGVVQIITPDGSGSGFIIDSDGRLVTNEHVIRGFSRVTVRIFDGTEYQADVLGFDQVADLTVVDIDGGQNLQPIPLGDSARVQVGEEVVALGFPLGSQLGESVTVTEGIISAKRTYDGVKHLQTTAAINPGNSGGPLFNRAGQVIGVNTWGIDVTVADNIAFAVSINEVKSRLESLKVGRDVFNLADWDKYKAGTYGYTISVAPGWTLDEDDETWDYASFWSADRKALVEVSAYDLSASDSLKEFAERRRDALMKLARDESWNVFEITSFAKKQEAGKEFYELAYRWQTSTDYCVSRDAGRIFLSSSYPDKPNGFHVTAGICEDSLVAHTAPAEAMVDSFVEWEQYRNAKYRYSLNIAPGWSLDEDNETDKYTSFWTTDQKGIVEVLTVEVSSSFTLEDFLKWRKAELERISDSWEVYQPALTQGLGGEPGAREMYLYTYLVQSSSETCLSGNNELIALSSFHPDHPYGFLVITGVCDPDSDLYDLYSDERWEMIWGFEY